MFNPRPTGRCLNIPRGFLHSCSDNCSAISLTIFGPGHQRSGHQVRSSRGGATAFRQWGQDFLFISFTACSPNFSGENNIVLPPQPHLRGGGGASCPHCPMVAPPMRSSDPISEKHSNRVTATVVKRRSETFRIWYTTKYLQLAYLGLFYIGDLRSGQFRDLPITHKSMGKNSNASNTYQICSNRSEPCSIRLLLMNSVQLCLCDPRKGHLRSNNDVMGSMYVFAYNF